jgi:PIN domain nuclease of toxin-antitoxin system
MSEGLLLDTCAAIWWAEGRSVSAVAKALIDAEAALARVYISPFVAWEVGLVQTRGRDPVIQNVELWYRALIGLEGFHEAALTARILAAAWKLPGPIHNDPADRIMISTAREFDLVLVTRDRAILSYGAQGHVRVLAC